MESHYRVVLVHGFLKSKKDMMVLEKKILEKGYSVENIELPLTFSEISICEEILANKIKNIKLSKMKNSKRIILIGHGLGGLLLRRVLPMFYEDFIDIKLILIGAPNRVPEIVLKNIKIIKLLSKIFKPLKIFFNNEIEKTITKKEIQIGVVAGTERGKKSILKDEIRLNDGVFYLEEVCFKFEHELLKIPFSHNELHKRNGTIEYIFDFIEAGKFDIK